MIVLFQSWEWTSQYRLGWVGSIRADSAWRDEGRKGFPPPAGKGNRGDTLLAYGGEEDVSAPLQLQKYLVAGFENVDQILH